MPFLLLDSQGKAVTAYATQYYIALLRRSKATVCFISVFDLKKKTQQNQMTENR